MGSRVAHGGPPSPCRRRPAREPWPTSPGPAGGTCCARTPAGQYRAGVGFQAPTACTGAAGADPVSSRDVSPRRCRARHTAFRSASRRAFKMDVCWYFAWRAGRHRGEGSETSSRPSLGVRSPFRARVDARDAVPVDIGAISWVDEGQCVDLGIGMIKRHRRVQARPALQPRAAAAGLTPGHAHNLEVLPWPGPPPAPAGPSGPADRHGWAKRTEPNVAYCIPLGMLFLKCSAHQTRCPLLVRCPARH
eukprot:COSAG06_NODE_14092_length_1191_cov_1.453297_1_plen_247_part_10